MKPWLLLLLAACQTPPDLVVVAYNIKHGRGMDGTVDLERAAQVIEAHDPDFVTLQEVDRECGRSGDVDQAAWMGERLGMHAVHGPFMAYDGGEYGMAVLSKAPIERSLNHPLPDGPEPRTALAVEAEGLIVVGVHLYGNDKQRLNQAQAMVDALERETLPVVLAGDFNSVPDSDVMALIRRTYTEAEKGEDRLTFNSVDPSVEIDFVLARPGFEKMELEVLSDPLTSDHRPMVLRVWR